MSRIGVLIGVLIVSFVYAEGYTNHGSLAFNGYTSRLVQLPDTIRPDTVLQDSIPPDSIKNDSSSEKLIKISSDSLDAPVKYHADQKTWMDMANKSVYLIGNAKVEYKDITLKADSIVFDWSTSQVIAIGRPDTSGKVIGKPVFSQGGNDYKAERIAYNFKTKKGKIIDITTEEGSGFIRSETVKRMPNEVLFGQNNTYTTCDKEHPHFYIETNKIKVIPNKAIVTGPANLVIADVRTPLVVPFGIFPINDKRKSGIIVPTYGVRNDLGYYLQNGGYYFGISDHFDLALTGSIYSNGSWLVNSASRFISKYHFSGGYSIQYANTRSFDQETNSYIPSQQFNVNATFAQDSKARPNSNFNATISFGSSGFNKTFADPTQTYLNNIYTSSISFHQTLPNTPFNFTISASHQQSTLTHIISLQLPVFNLSMNQVYPFKRKIQVGNLKWYEKIGLTYTMDARNQSTGIDSTFLSQNTLNQSLSGVQQTVPVSAPFQLFKYITVTPSFNYHETWSLQEFKRSWNDDSNEVRIDTLQNFITGRDYSLGVGTSLRLYGIVQFKKGKIQAIRHVLTPSVSYAFRPDFSKPKYGYYYSAIYDSLGHTQQYSIFQGAVYGGPPAGEFNGLTFGLNNNLEMKVASKKDTVSGTKKIKLLDALNLTGAYNFAADSFNLSPFNLSARTTLFDKIGINFSSIFDPYYTDTSGQRRNIYLWDAQRRLVRLTDATVGINANFASPKGSTPKLTQEQTDYVLFSGNKYADFNIPWTFGFGYNLFIRKANSTLGTDTTTFTQTLSLMGSFNLTPNWRVSAQTSYDFVQKKFPTAYLSISRDLHCWEMAIQWIPFGDRQSYQFTLRAKAGVLQDLKLHKQSDWYSY